MLVCFPFNITLRVEILQKHFIFCRSSFQGMDLIETLDPSSFTDYLKRFNNTICGRHPIGVMLQVILEFKIIFIPIAK